MTRIEYLLWLRFLASPSLMAPTSDPEYTLKFIHLPFPFNLCILYGPNFFIFITYYPTGTKKCQAKRLTNCRLVGITLMTRAKRDSDYTPYASICQVKKYAIMRLIVDLR